MSIIKQFSKDGVEVHVHDTCENMGIAAADDVEKLIAELSQTQDEVNILLPIAESQYTFLKSLFSRNIDWSKVSFFHVDEYIGLDANDKRTLQNELKREFLQGISYKGGYFLDGTVSDPAAECKRYAKVLNDHPIDISVLGFGDNGHLAFNEPHCADFHDPEAVKVIEIDGISKKQQIASGYFKDAEDMPDFAYTLTLPTLMSAKYKICVVPFKNKAQSSYDALYGSVDTQCPASVIRTTNGVVAHFDSDSGSKFLD